MMRLKEQGITVFPIADVEKLGLERVRASFTLPSALNEEIKPLFGGLHQSAGLTYYARSMVDHSFDCEFVIPQNTTDELSELLLKLEEMNLIKRPESRRLAWKDVLMLKTKFYDYAKNEWDVDFSTLTGDPSSIRIPEMSAPEDFDYSDLLIIKELQMDAWIKAVNLASKIGVPPADVNYHLNRHVFGRRLIRSFRLRWTGSKEAWLKHSVVLGTYLFKEISDEKARHAMSVMTSAPFTWSHMRGEDGTYLAEVVFPVSNFSETLQFISNQLRVLDLTPNILFKDWACTSTYTIPYTLYDKERLQWRFDSGRALEYTLQMIKTYA